MFNTCVEPPVAYCGRRVEPFVEKMPRGNVFEDLDSPPVSPPRAEKTPVLVDIVKEEPMVAIEDDILEEMEEMEEMTVIAEIYN